MQTVKNQTVLSKESSFKEGSLSYIYKDCLKYAPAKVLGMLMNLLLVPVYTGLLTKSQYGLYSVAIAFLSFIAIIFSDWVGVSGLRFFEQHNKSNCVSSYFSTLLFLITSNLTIMYVVVYLLRDILQDFFNIPSYALISVALLIFPVAFRALQFQVLRAQIKPFVYSIIVVINQLTTICGAYYFIKYLNMGAMGILAGMAISISAVDLIMLIATGLWKGMKPKLINFKTLKNFYIYGLPIALSSLGMWFITQSNKVIMQKFHSEFGAVVGVSYGLSFSILFPLFAILTLAAIPRIINLYEDKFDVRPIITKITAYFITIFAPVVFIYCIFARDIILTFSNAKYIDAQIFLPFLALSAFFFGMAEYTVVQYHLIKKTYLHTIIKVTPSIIGLITAIILLPKMDGTNVLWLLGITTLSSQVLYFVLSLLIRIKNLAWVPPYKIIGKMSVSLFGSYLLFALYDTFVTFDNLFLNSAVILVSYALLMKLQVKKLRKLDV